MSADTIQSIFKFIDTKMTYVYHSSNKQGLTVIKPSAGTHGNIWVYAARDMVVAALFVSGLGGDLTCSVGRDSETVIPYICERFEGAFHLRYSNVSGSIYILPGEFFQRNETQWDEEVVCGKEIIPVKEIRVADSKQHLLQLEREGKLLIKYHPERIDGIPPNDEDLVRRAAVWHQRFGDEILARVEMYQPQLLDRVCEAIRTGGYAKE